MDESTVRHLSGLVGGDDLRQLLSESYWESTKSLTSQQNPYGVWQRRGARRSKHRKGVHSVESQIFRDSDPDVVTPDPPKPVMRFYPRKTGVWVGQRKGVTVTISLAKRGKFLVTCGELRVKNSCIETALSRTKLNFVWDTSRIKGVSSAHQPHSFPVRRHHR